jgi:hypothetical protein
MSAKSMAAGSLRPSFLAMTELIGVSLSDFCKNGHREEHGDAAIQNTKRAQASAVS